MSNNFVVVQDNEVTAVSDQFWISHAGEPDEAIKVTASAKRHPKDRPNDEIGLLLAQARMYAQVAVELNQRAWEMIEGDPITSFLEKLVPDPMRQPNSPVGPEELFCNACDMPKEHSLADHDDQGCLYLGCTCTLPGERK